MGQTLLFELIQDLLLKVEACLYNCADVCNVEQLIIIVPYIQLFNITYISMGDRRKEGCTYLRHHFQGRANLQHTLSLSCSLQGIELIRE